MYAKQIKLIGTINLVGVGFFCLIILFGVRLNEEANFCSGNYLSDDERKRLMVLDGRNNNAKEYFLHRGYFLYQYTAIVVILAGLFIVFISTFCVYNLKKMGF